MSLPLAFKGINEPLKPPNVPFQIEGSSTEVGIRLHHALWQFHEDPNRLDCLGLSHSKDAVELVHLLRIQIKIYVYFTDLLMADRAAVRR